MAAGYDGGPEPTDTCGWARANREDGAHQGEGHDAAEHLTVVMQRDGGDIPQPAPEPVREALEFGPRLIYALLPGVSTCDPEAHLHPERHAVVVAAVDVVVVSGQPDALLVCIMRACFMRNLRSSTPIELCGILLGGKYPAAVGARIWCSAKQWPERLQIRFVVGALVQDRCPCTSTDSSPKGRS